MFQYQSQDGGLRNSILAELCRRTAEKQQLSGHLGGTPGRAPNSSVPTATTENASVWRKPDGSTARKK